MKKADSAKCHGPRKQPLVADSGHCSTNTIRSVGIGEVGRECGVLSAGTQLHVPFPIPQHISIHCWVWVQWTGVLDLEVTIPFCGVCRPSCMQF